MSCFLVLQDGTVFEGRSFGAPALKVDELPEADALRGAGEVVFNTGMTGYPEILTDPSYAGQLVVMTYPHIGNYGTDEEWSESGPNDRNVLAGTKAAGFVVRSLYRGMVPAGRGSLDAYLRQNKTPGISDVDTRALTLKIREGGSPKGMIVESPGDSLSSAARERCLAFLSDFPEMEGRSLIGVVGSEEPKEHNPSGSPHFALVDCGTKANILRELLAIGCRVTVVPSSVSAEQLLAMTPDAILYSNGPGDPAVLTAQVAEIRKLLGKVPLHGICLGHQLICQALGARTFKMKFGHHGLNHPVRDEFTKKVFVTSQNHGFSVDEGSLPKETEVWFRNANDQTIEGIRHQGLSVLTSQFHPESAPGPHDSSWIFREFRDSVTH